MTANVQTVTIADFLRSFPAEDEAALFCANGNGAFRFDSFLVPDENKIEHEWRLHFADGAYDNYYSSYKLVVPFERWKRFVSDDLWCRVFGYTNTYEKVIWQNKIYDFNPTQARLVSQMHSQFTKGNEQQFEKTIFSKSMVNLSDYRLDKAFRSLGGTHELFGKLISKAENQRGAYRFQPWTTKAGASANLPRSWRFASENAQKAFGL